MRIFLLHRFSNEKTAGEFHNNLVTMFGEDVITKHQCQNCFEHFQNGEMSLKNHEHGKWPEIMDNKALKASIKLDLCQTTRELAKQFGCTHGTIENHLHVI